MDDHWVQVTKETFTIERTDKQCIAEDVAYYAHRSRLAMGFALAAMAAGDTDEWAYQQRDAAYWGELAVGYRVGWLVG